MILPASDEEPLYPQSKALPGFQHIKRYWDKSLKCYAAKILPGEFYVSNTGEMVVTVLGSCVSACIRDRVNGIGGMNHFMLPNQHHEPNSMDAKINQATRYGNWAMEYLINEILKNGGCRKNLEVKIFGGAHVLTNMETFHIGQDNIDFIGNYLRQENILPAAQDLGGTLPRKVLYFSDTGSVKVRKVKSSRNNTIYTRENDYAKQINGKPSMGEIELF